MAAKANANGTVDDMISLPELTENSILNNLKQRYANQTIYTYTGSILVALNPFQSMQIYENETVFKYHRAKLSENPPHIFGIAEAALANSKNFKQSQAIIISGESGAGKTESTKVILQFLTAVTSNTVPVASTNVESQSWVEQQILEANTILESFGNAKTVRNNNSSRFGKFVQVLFDQQHQIIGASIANYLLEKSRVVSQAKGERNYHVFCELTSGATAEERQKYKLLAGPQAYQYLNQTGSVEISGVNDKRSFENLKLALSVLKLGPEEVDVIFAIVSAILRLGNVSFNSEKGGEAVSIAKDSQEHVATVAQLLQCDQGQLQEALCTRKIIVRNEATFAQLKPDQAMENRDSIAKMLYDRLFNFIVEYINTSTATSKKPAVFIGVLDIFGFEAFEVNSFEQLCINYTNEKLQQFFNQFIFKLEQEEYMREDINWKSVSYKDNQPCLDLIDGKGGVLSALDEECKMPKGGDETYLQKLNETFAGKNEYFLKPKTAKSAFGIKHYAGEVSYTVTGFVDKNKDAVPEQVLDLLAVSKSATVTKIYKRVEVIPTSPVGNGTIRGAPAKTAAANFKNQLTNLVTTLTSTTPHYVRCIKPNMEKVAFKFNDEIVTAQLRYSGMMESIAIRKAGFASRLPFDQFATRFRFLRKGDSLSDAKQNCLNILQNVKLPAEEWQLGKTKVFVKQKASEHLQTETDKFRAHYVKTLQRLWRKRKIRREFWRTYKSAVVIQKYTRMFLCRLKYQKQRKAIIKIQAAIRGWFARDFFRAMKAEQMASSLEKDAKSASASRKDFENAREQQKIASYAAQLHNKVQSAASAGQDTGIDNLFSFLGDFDTMRGTLRKKNVKQPSEFAKSLVSDLSLSPTNTGMLSRGQGGNSDALADLPPPPPPPPAPRLKFNPLAAKLNAEDEAEKQVDYSMKAYAEKNFEKHPKAAGTLSTLRGKSMNKMFVPIEEMLLHCKTPIPLPMIKIPGATPKVAETAIECFKHLLKLCEPNKKAEDAYSSVKFIIQQGIETSELRDEIYVQIIRQLTPNPQVQIKNWGEVEQNIWLLLALVCGCFPPSKSFSKYFVQFLKQFVESDKSSPTSSEKSVFAGYCETSVKALILNGARRRPPSLMEINSVRNRSPILCRFYFMDGQVKAIAVTPVTTSAEAMKEITKKIELKDTNGWSVYEVTPVNERSLKGNDYIADILASWETVNKTSMAASAYQTVRKNMKPETTSQQSISSAIGGGDAKLYIKKRLFRNPQDIPSDPVEFKLTYCQYVQAVLRDEFVMSEKVAIQLAGIKAQVDWGDYDPAQKSRYTTLQNYIPANMIPKQADNFWSKGIEEYHGKLSGKNDIQARLLFWEVLKQFKNYGSTLYYVKYQGFWQHPSNIIIALSAEKVQFLLKSSRETAETFNYQQIHSWEVDNDTITLNVFKKVTENKENREVVMTGVDEFDAYKFQTAQAEDISGLLKEYSLRNGGDRRRDRDFFVSEVEFSFFCKDLEKARNVVVNKEIVRVPGPDGPPINPETNEPMFNNQDNTKYFITDWCFSQKPLTAPLLAQLNDPTDIESALNMYTFILIYGGLVPGVSPSEFDPPAIPYGTMIQTVVEKCLEVPLLIDELYLQLMKCTSEFPVPDAVPVLQFWRLFSIIVGCLKPTKPEVIEMARAHFRRWSSIESRTPEMKQRKEEAKHARFCAKVFQRCVHTEPRKCAPSFDEIYSSARLTNIPSRFHFTDNQFRAIVFDPLTTVVEALQLLKEKIQMPNATGFALYETFGGLERNMFSTEKISDIISKWEKFSRTSESDKTLRLVMKKRLFMDPLKASTNETEEHLLMTQAIEDVVMGRYPLDSKEAVLLAALRTQAEYGSASANRQTPYPTLVEKYVPKNLYSETIVNELASAHMRLGNMTPADSNKEYMKQIRTWPLYGATVFEVVQNYTDQIPSNCWLLVNHTGLHISERCVKKPIVSYPYNNIVSYSPSAKSIMIVTGSVARGTKYVFSTVQSAQIAHLLKDYAEETAKLKPARK